MKDSLPWKKLEHQLEDEAYREQIIKFAGLSDDVKSSNLFSSKVNNNTVTSKDKNFHLPHTNPDPNKPEHMNLFQANQEFDMNQSQTVSLGKTQIYHSMRDAVLEYIPRSLRIRKPIDKSPKINPETVLFTNLLMDKATHLKNYPLPYEPRLAKFVAARRDAYVPRDGVDEPSSIWPGSEVEYVDAGHISASLSNLGLFRRIIKEKMDEVTKYIDWNLILYYLL